MIFLHRSTVTTSFVRHVIHFIFFCVLYFSEPHELSYCLIECVHVMRYLNVAWRQSICSYWLAIFNSAFLSSHILEITFEIDIMSFIS